MIEGLLAYLHGLRSALTQGEDGQTLVEYAMLILFIAIALIGVLTVLAGTVGGFFTTLESSL
jgi:Flp pilus assembly pilin Flp